MGADFRWTKKVAVWAIFIFSLLTYVGFIQSGTAWHNGSMANNQTNYNYDSHYSTHDWVAEAALDALVKVDPGNWNWLVERKSIFLVGTEAPDSSDVSMTLDGTAVTGFHDMTYHHIYFNDDNTIYNNEDDAGVRAKWCGDSADVAMDAQKRDLAAFYLGAMTHYIADLGSFAHVIDGVDTSTHNSFEGYVDTRTNDHDNRQEFFTISSFTVTSKTPYNAAKELGWDTYKDPTTAHGAQWLWDNLFSDWKQTFATRTADTQSHQDYYNRVEQNLNTAIAACAAAMNGALGVGSTGTTSATSANNGIPACPLPIFAGFVIIAVVGLIGWKHRKNHG